MQEHEVRSPRDTAPSKSASASISKSEHRPNSKRRWPGRCTIERATAGKPYVGASTNHRGLLPSAAMTKLRKSRARRGTGRRRLRVRRGAAEPGL